MIADYADPLAQIRRDTLAMLRPPPKIATADWIESNIHLPESASAQPGRIRLWAYQRGICDALDDPAIERISVLKSARVGYSALMQGVIGSCVANAPSPIMVVQPTTDDARRYAVDLEEVFEASPNLRGLLASGPDDRSTMYDRRFAGGSLKLVGAKAPRNLRGHTVQNLILDEVDGYEATAEGDPVALAIERTRTFPTRKILMGSTPIFDTGPISRAFERSDKRIWEVPCPSCGEFSEIRWADIRWEDRDPATTYWRCPNNGCVVTEEAQPGMVAHGRWRATAPEVKGHAGFRINALASPHRAHRWSVLVAEFLEAKKTPETLQVFTNTVLGEVWRTNGEEVDEDALAARREPFSLTNLPADVLFLTAGVDVQNDRLEVVILGHGRTALYALDHRVIYGPFDGDVVWQDLDSLLRMTWSHPLGFLTAAERKHIEALRDSGKQAEARTQAFAIFERKYGDIAAQMDGPWSQILSNFGDAWGAFGKWMLDGIQWDAIKREMGAVIALVARLSAMLPAVDKNSARYLRQRHGEIDAEIRRNQDRINRGLGDIPTNGLPGSSDAYSNIARLEEERDQVLRKLFAAEGRLATAPDTTTRPPSVNRTSPGRVALPRPTSTAREDNSAEIADQNALKAIEAARLDLAERRGEIESRADFIARQTAERLNDAAAERKAEFGEIIGQLYDWDAAARRLGDAEKSTNDLLHLRGALIAEMQTAADTGDQTRLEELRQRATEINAQLIAAAQAALGLMAGLAGPEAELARFSLETLLRDAGLLTDQLGKVGAKAVVTAEDIDQMIVGGGVNAFDDFAQGLAEGANAFDAMRDAFLRFAGDFLRQIALMIVQRAIFNALGGGGEGSSIGKGVSGFVNGLFGSKHTGGLVGSGGMFRSVSPAVFAGATRYHSGGLVGLAPNEVPIIAKRNEEVLTESDPRHRANGGGFGGARSIKVTNVFDPGDILSKGLASESGEASFWNFVRANSQQFKANLG